MLTYSKREGEGRTPRARRVESREGEKERRVWRRTRGDASNAGSQYAQMEREDARRGGPRSRERNIELHCTRVGNRSVGKLVREITESFEVFCL